MKSVKNKLFDIVHKCTISPDALLLALPDKDIYYNRSMVDAINTQGVVPRVWTFPQSKTAPVSIVIPTILRLQNARLQITVAIRWAIYYEVKHMLRKMRH